jgi:hypothetical protein
MRNLPTLVYAISRIKLLGEITSTRFRIFAEVSECSNTRTCPGTKSKNTPNH